MNGSDRISNEHVEQLAILSPGKRQAVLREASELIGRARVAALGERRRGSRACIAADSDLLKWLKSLPPGSQITKVSLRKKD